MAKKKARKVDRAIEKLLRAGRYWEWLKEVESQNREARYAQEYAEVWKGLVRKALRNPQSFQEFCKEVKAVKHPPNSQDVNFLRILAGFIDGNQSVEDLAALKGLGQPAETLRQRALSWKDDSASLEPMRKELRVFMTQPQKVTTRYYEQAGLHFPIPGFRETAAVMAEDIAAVRRLNSKSAAEKGWKVVGFHQLSVIDASLAEGMDVYPQAFYRILIHPFVWNMAVLMERLSKEGNSVSMAKLVRSIPFLFQQVAGEKAETIHQALKAFQPEIMADASAGQLQAEMDSAGFEEKVMFLGTLRRQLREKSRSAHGPLDMIFDEFEEDEEETEKLFEVFRRLFHQVLDEIGQKAKEIGPRDERELRRVMDQIVVEDLDLLIDAPDRSSDMARLFSHLASVGCLGKRMALFALIVAAARRSTTLQASAQEALDRSAPVTGEDLRWILEKSQMLHFPRLSVLKPLLDRFREDAELLGLTLRELLSELWEFVFLSTFAMDAMGMHRKRGEKTDPKVERILQELRQESAALKHYTEFHLIPGFLECFRGGTYTEESFLQWLSYLRENCDNYLSFVEDELQHLAGWKARGEDLFFMMAGLTVSLEGTVLSLFKFLKEHSDDWATADIRVLERLVDNMLFFKPFLERDAGVLVRMGAVLQKRFDAGEREVGPLMETVKLALKEIAYPGKRVGRRKGKKRP